MKNILKITIIAACVLCIGQAALAKTIHVKNAGTITGPGDSWDTAYRYLADALAVATAGDEVWVQEGGYTQAITVPSGVALYGGFMGTETSLSQRPTFPRMPLTAYRSTIYGTHDNNRLVTIPNSATSATRVDGFAIQTCNNGGITVGTGAAPVITNCSIAYCKASYGAGIVIQDDATPLITKNEIAACDAHCGGGISATRAHPTIINNTFSGNTAWCDTTCTSDDYAVGAAIYLNYCNTATPILIANNTIWNNSANRNGGAVYCGYSNVTITGNVMYSNDAFDGRWEARFYGQQGGAIYCNDSQAVINHNTMCWNIGGRGGGAMCFDAGSSATCYGNILYDNRGCESYGWNVYNKGNIANVVMDYNDSICEIDNGYSFVTVGSHDISVDPVFVNNNYQSPNYRLASGSPCVNAGYPGAVGLQAVDADGNPRVIGPIPDMGGYEYYMVMTGLSDDTPISKTAVPGNYWFQVLANRWAAVGIAPSDNHDISADTDVWMNPAYATSASTGTLRDFIVANGTSYGAATHYAQVSTGSTGSYSIEADWSAKSISSGIPESGSMSASEVVDVYQASLAADTSYRITVHVTSGTPDLSLFVFKPSKKNGSRSTADWSSASGSAGTDEMLYAVTTQAGTYGIIVVNEGATAGTYNLSITEMSPVTIFGHVGNFAGSNLYRTTIYTKPGSFSATTNEYGNFTLTVPYYWSGSVFPERSGWVFTPGYLTYANLITNATGANFTGGQVTTVGGTKSLPNGRSVYLSDKPVTAVFGSDSYIEDTNRAAGIHVVGAAPTASSVTIGGVLSSASGERRITLPTIISTGSATVQPLYMSNKSIGGAATGYAPGIVGTTGVNNVGLLVKTSGTVTSASGNIFYINDGSNIVDTEGTLGIRIDTGGLCSAPLVGKQVTVTGISSVWMNGTTAVRTLLPRSADDVQRLYKIALVYGSDTTIAQEIHDLAVSKNIDTTLIPDASIASADFSSYDAILISSGSLAYSTTGAAAKITNTGLPVMGMGTGGSHYFETRNLRIGWSHSSTTTGSSTIVPRVSNSPIFNTPNEITGSSITPYSSNVSGVLVYMPTAVTGVTRLASPPDPAASYYLLCSQSRCLLWGYEPCAHGLTSTGEKLFINAIYYTLGL
ncbi:MAG: choice-of-anchor Q domain-containing protein [Armatimonadota bacterium]|nr:pre-peptidase C-terminal domain-containing protein [bacterium]